MTCLHRGYKLRVPSAACFVLHKMLAGTGGRMLMLVLLEFLLIGSTAGYGFTNITSVKRVLVIDHVRCSEFKNFCPNGYSCIYWEEYCPSQPCRLFPFCRLTLEVRRWLEECRNIGCSSEACFLRQRRDCNFIPCDYYADCVYTEGDKNPAHPIDPCRSYICPKGYTCQAKIDECKRQCTAQISCISTHIKRKMDARNRYSKYHKTGPMYEIRAF